MTAPQRHPGVLKTDEPNGDDTVVLHVAEQPTPDLGKPGSAGQEPALPVWPGTVRSARPPAPKRSGAGRRLVGVLRAHPWFLLLLAAGVTIRSLYLSAYPPIFVIYPDSTDYVTMADTLRPTYLRPFGYSLLLRLLSWTEDFTVVAVVQHLAGLALGVAVYAFLRHRGVGGGLATLAAAPVMLDAWQLGLEHYVMSDTQFTVLVASGFMVLMWKDRPGWVATGVAGLLLALAGLTRTVGLPLCLAVLGLLVVRRLGWRPFLTCLLATAIPLGGYMVLFHAEYGVYGFGKYTGRAYYGRAAQIVDCNRVPNLTAEERKLCPKEPLEHRYAADVYGLFSDSPAAQFEFEDPIFDSFTNKVFAAQTKDLLKIIGVELTYYFRYGSAGDRFTCLSYAWAPKRPGLSWPEKCYPHMGQKDFNPQPVDPDPDINDARRTVMAYGDEARTPPWLVIAAMVTAIVAFFRRRRVPGWGDGRDALILVGAAATLLVMAVVGAMFDIRYLLPALPLLGMAGALGAHRLGAIRDADRAAASG